MTDWSQLLADIEQVAKAADMQGQEQEIRVLVEMCRAKLILDLGKSLGGTVAAHRQAGLEIAPRLVNTASIVSQVADCFKIIALREWLGEDPQRSLEK